TDGPLLVATRVNVTRLPVGTVWVTGLLTTLISVTGVIVTVTGVLVEGVGSVGLLTVAVFVTVIGLAVVLVAVATTVTVTLLPTATLAKTQLSGLALLQLPLLGDAEMNVRPAGRLSVTVTAVALEGPLLVATRVNVTTLPVVTVCDGG